MTRSKLNAALMLSVAAGWPVAAHADDQSPGFAITTPGIPAIGFVTGDSVAIQVAGPSDNAVRGTRLTLNGHNVTSSLSQAGAGTVTGLTPGANVLQLFAERDSDEPVARLVVERATTPAMACAAIANLSGFPVQSTGSQGGTTITLAQLNPASATLPEHCQVQGILQSRTGVSGLQDTPQQYGTTFEVRLPSLWNGRYMFQGGGGTEGSLPPATGSQTGTASFPELANGFVVASQDGGHETSELPPTTVATATSPSVLQVNMFFPDQEAVQDWAFTSIDTTTQTAKFLIDSYYGRPVDKSYFVGCSTSGRQAMAMTQLFPTYYDGVIAGDPFYLPPDISLSETWGLEQIISVSPKDTSGNPIFTQGFTLADQNLFTNAILAACDGLDGLVDGVIDNLAACRFNPASFVFPSSGPYGSIAPGQPLQCKATKTATCLTPAQVTAVQKIVQGPRTSKGSEIVSPDGTLVSGYPLDGGFMMPQGIPTRDIGTANSPPGNIGLGTGQLPLFWFTTPDPTFNPVNFNYDKDIPLVVSHSPAVNKSQDISAFFDRGGKLLFYHGLSDSGPPWPYTVEYVTEQAQRQENRNDGRGRGSSDALGGDLMKLYLVPNMGHCGGNASTDQFDMLTPMVNWIENGVTPKTVIASGVNFSSTLGTLTGLPTTRSRPLCPYPQTVRYTGPKGGDISASSNYTCGNFDNGTFDNGIGDEQR